MNRKYTLGLSIAAMIALIGPVSQAVEQTHQSQLLVEPWQQPTPALMAYVEIKGEKGQKSAAALGESDGSYGPIGQSDTLWSIATKVRPDKSVTVYQTIIALYEANPQAFENGRIDRLVGGSILEVPNLATIQSVSANDAAARFTALAQPSKPAGPTPEQIEAEQKAEAYQQQVDQLTVSLEQKEQQIAGTIAEEKARFEQTRQTLIDELESAEAAMRALRMENERLKVDAESLSAEVAMLREQANKEEATQSQVTELLAAQREIKRLKEQQLAMEANKPLHLQVIENPVLVTLLTTLPVIIVVLIVMLMMASRRARKAQAAAAAASAAVATAAVAAAAMADEAEADQAPTEEDLDLALDADIEAALSLDDDQDLMLDEEISLESDLGGDLPGSADDLPELDELLLPDEDDSDVIELSDDKAIDEAVTDEDLDIGDIDSLLAEFDGGDDEGKSSAEPEEVSEQAEQPVELSSDSEIEAQLGDDDDFDIDALLDSDSDDTEPAADVAAQYEAPLAEEALELDDDDALDDIDSLLAESGLTAPEVKVDLEPAPEPDEQATEADTELDDIDALLAQTAADQQETESEVDDEGVSAELESDADLDDIDALLATTAESDETVEPELAEEQAAEADAELDDLDALLASAAESDETVEPELAEEQVAEADAELDDLDALLAAAGESDETVEPELAEEQAAEADAELDDLDALLAAAAESDETVEPELAEEQAAEADDDLDALLAAAAKSDEAAEPELAEEQAPEAELELIDEATFEIEPLTEMEEEAEFGADFEQAPDTLEDAELEAQEDDTLDLEQMLDAEAELTVDVDEDLALEPAKLEPQPIDELDEDAYAQLMEELDGDETADEDLALEEDAASTSAPVVDEGAGREFDELLDQLVDENSQAANEFDELFSELAADADAAEPEMDESEQQQAAEEFDALLDELTLEDDSALPAPASDSDALHEDDEELSADAALEQMLQQSDSDDEADLQAFDSSFALEEPHESLDDALAAWPETVESDQATAERVEPEEGEAELDLELELADIDEAPDLQQQDEAELADAELAESDDGLDFDLDSDELGLSLEESLETPFTEDESVESETEVEAKPAWDASSLSLVDEALTLEPDSAEAAVDDEEDFSAALEAESEQASVDTETGDDLSFDDLLAETHPDSPLSLETPTESTEKAPSAQPFVEVDELLAESDEESGTPEPMMGKSLIETALRFDDIAPNTNHIDVDADNGYTAKLDLARAYIEIDDPDGATDILDDVIANGNDVQRQEALQLKSLLS